MWRNHRGDAPPNSSSTARSLGGDFHATVHRTTLAGAVVGDRHGLALAGDHHLGGGNTLPGQVVGHGIGATLGQLHVVGVGAHAVGVTDHIDGLVAGAGVDLGSGVVQHGDDAGLQTGAVEVEVVTGDVDAEMDDLSGVNYNFPSMTVFSTLSS